MELKKKLNKFILFAIILIGFIAIAFGEMTVAYASPTVMLGGKPLGIAIRSNGIVVIEAGDVITDKGAINPTNGLLLKGDIITGIDGNEIKTIKDLSSHLENKKSKISILRRGEALSFEFKPEKDALTKEYKLGLYVKEEVDGIGTLTFVTSDGKYGALGHRISDFETGLTFEFQKGEIYNAHIRGIVKGVKGKAGELCGGFYKANSNGTIEKNTPYGIFGDIKEYEGKKISIASLGEIKEGKAQIYTTIGETTDFYDITILKTFKQNSIAEKGMVIQITDPRLIEKTGGIVQGMSGSPIIQNNKLVGAVTHVFTNDPTKGYGIYIPWMVKTIGN